MKLSEANAALLDSAIMVYNLICVSTPTKTHTKKEIRDLLFLGACDLVFEHHGAILNLLQQGQREGSALALLRPIIETMNRAVWLKVCATDDQVEAISKEKQNFPGLERVAAEIEKTLAGTGGAGKFELLRQYRDDLHGFTHSGMQQLKFRFNAEWILSPTYPERVLAHLIRASARCATHPAMIFFHEIDEAEAADLIADVYNKQFGPGDEATA